MLAVLSPVDQTYCVALPVAVSTVSAPLQALDGPLMLTVGAAYTITSLEAELVHPKALVTFNVYTLVDVT